MSEVRLNLNCRRIQRMIWLVLALFALLSYMLQSTVGSTYFSITAQPYGTVNLPPVILQNGTAGSSVIYTNSTSAKVNVAAPELLAQNYDFVLRVNNTVTDSWDIRLKKYADSNIDRLQNCTIYFHNSTDRTSSQIYIQNGSYMNQTGPWYALETSETIYIAMTVYANSTETSYVYSYLEIRIPSTTTYAQYIITFEIT